MAEEDRVSSERTSESEFGQDSPELIFKFRNYTPQTHFLEGLYTVERSQPATIDHLIKDKIDLVSSQDTGYRIDPKLFEPKKIDWDLKRRIEKRLELLESDTRKSISKHVKNSKKKR